MTSLFYVPISKNANQDDIQLDRHDHIIYHFLIMAVFYRAPFRRFVKRQARPFQLAIEDEVERLASDPDIGTHKKGDLAGFRVHKFTFRKQRVLVAYRMIKDDIVFYMVGPHENFYRELKRYIREVK